MKLANKKVCSGCHACFNVCPKHCITMEYDEEGFLQPQINKSVCVECGMCKSICPVLKEYKGHSKGKAFACFNKNDDIRMQSSSGGVFSLIAEYVLDKGGVVFGASFDDELNVKHIAVNNKEDLRTLRGSKYIQSKIGDSFEKCKEQLEKGILVLFSGTPCQISGLKSYLGREYENLITQDIICHGVPSHKVWQAYLCYQQKVHKSKVDRDELPAFRCKDKGWKRFSVSLRFVGNIKYRQTLDKDPYMKAFLSNVCLRLSCYNCHSKSIERESDITLADFWGVDNILPEMDDDKGTSLVLVNSEKGRRIFKDTSCFMTYKEINIDEAIRYNSAAVRSCMKHDKRKKFLKRIESENFSECIDRYAKDPTILQIKIKVKKIIDGVFNNG